MNGSLLEFDRLTLRLGNRTLVQDLSLCIHGGEIWCLLGANGAGKTTLLHTAMGLRQPYSGSIRLAGRDLTDWPLPAAARVRGYVSQLQHDSFSATVLDTVLLGRYPFLTRWQWESDADREVARQALAIVDLANLENRDVLTLSGGERQRVALAMLFALDPPLLLLDEPVSHLDLHHQVMILKHLRRLTFECGKAVLFTIHDLNLAARFATHALLIGPEGYTSQGLTSEVMAAPQLQRAFTHPITRIDTAGRTLFLAD